jgi:heptosyltransferase-2
VTDGKTLVIQTAFLGDVILTTPLLSVLAQRFGPVDVITTPAASVLLDGHPAVGEVIRYDKRSKDRGWRGLRRLSSGLKARAYARAVIPHRSWRSAALAWLSDIPERIGFSDGARLFYTHSVRRPRSGHEVDRLLTLAGTVTQAPAVSLPLDQADEAEAEQWLRGNNVPNGFVALAPGSIWATKRWPFYPELAAALEGAAVVIGGPDDRPAGERIVEATGGRARNAAGALSLRGSAALLRRASLLVTNDSAPLHLATAAATPIVAIFGPTVAAFGFGPRGVSDIVVGHPTLSCRPCSRHGPQACPLGHHRCMRDVSPAAVLEAVNLVRTRSTAGVH